MKSYKERVGIFEKESNISTNYPNATVLMKNIFIEIKA